MGETASSGVQDPAATPAACFIIEAATSQVKLENSNWQPETRNWKLKADPNLRTRSNIAAAIAVLASSLPLLAQDSSCAVDPHSSACGLDSTLRLLHWLAAALALLLVGIIAVAVVAYRKNKNKKLTLDD